MGPARSACAPIREELDGVDLIVERFLLKSHAVAPAAVPRERYAVPGGAKPSTT